MQGLKDMGAFDVLIVGDVDEIPSAAAVRKYKRHLGLCSLEMNLYYYYLNYLSNDNNGKLAEAKIIPTAEFAGKTLCGIRYQQAPKIPNAGWHFSYQGGIDAIIKKIASFAHTEYNKPEILDRNRIEKLVNEGKDVFGRNLSYKTVPIDASYPEFVRENIVKLQHMIKG
jgi:beta-1,4-mannosyl-glycoprotein beta-1,4-N-acetylglucosaminyltransferase